MRIRWKCRRAEDTRAQWNQKKDCWTRERSQLRLLLIASTIILAALVIAGVVVQRSARTPLVQVGQLAPEFTLPSTDGDCVSLAAQRGCPVVLAFVPSVQCDFCREQLLTLQAALPSLRAQGVVIFVISIDTPAVQRIAVNDLALDYPILSEAPIVSSIHLSLLWGWMVDGVRPDMSSTVEAVIALVGAAIIVYWPRGIL